MDKSTISENHELKSSSGELSRSDLTDGEHPLSLGESSVWNKFFQVSDHLPLALGKKTVLLLNRSYFHF